MQVFIDFLAPIVHRVQRKAQTAQNANRKGGGQQRSLRTFRWISFLEPSTYECGMLPENLFAA